LKLIVALQLRGHPLLQPDVGLDTTAYVELANRVRAGDVGLGPDLYFVSPLYIYFLAAVLAAFDSFTAVRLVQIALGTASVGFIYLMAREWFGPRAAWIALALASLTGLFTFYESLILQASIDAFLTSAALLALTLGLKNRSNDLFFSIAGLMFGLQTLNRPNIAIAALGVAVVLVAIKRLRLAVLFFAGLLLGIAPVAVRNIAVSHQFSFVSSHGGLNFYIGNNETATGFYHPVPGITPTILGQEKDTRQLVARAVGHAVSDAEASDYLFGKAWTWIREHPAAAMALFARKLGWTFHAQHIALPHSYPFYALDAQTALRFLPVGPWLLMPLGLVGLFAAAPTERRAEYLVWAAFVPAYAIAVAAFFIAERYRLPLLVPLCVTAAAAIDGIARAAEARRWRAVMAASTVVGVLLVALNGTHGLDDGRAEERVRLAERLAMTGRYDEAERRVAELPAGTPERARAHYVVGLQLLAKDQTTGAVAHLERAHRQSPANPTIEYALGQALLKAGRNADAVPHLVRGLEAGAQVPVAGYDLAIALQQTGDLPAAAAVIRRIRPTDDADVEVWLRLGRLASEVKAPDVAEPFFRRAADMRPDQASARQQYGLNLLVLERYGDAARELSEAVRLDPRDADSLSHLAFAEFRVGRIDEAKRHAAAALAIDPENQLAGQLSAAMR
jgi:Flp pilus assembly protein TadD/4-amino-4-deoxy-L-arabinose transferase-like glycosyltransferase